nr:putative capsid protein [Crucivirus sp.]
MTSISNREYVGDILASATIGAFQLQQFFINPGQSATFPWLSTIAGNYVKYAWKRLTFHFISTSATALNSTNTQLGIVVGRNQYDPTYPVDTVLTQMQNSFDSVQSNPSKSWDFPFNLSHADRLLTMRTGAQPSGTDLRMYDLGFFELATQAMQAASVNVGQLWVSYEVVLFTPNYIQGQIGQTLLSYSFWNKTGCTPTNIFGTVASGTVRTGSNLSMTLANNAVMTFPATVSTGYYLITVSAATASAVITVPNPTITLGTLIQYWGDNSAIDDSSQQLAPAAGETASYLFGMWLVKVNAPGYSQCVVDWPAFTTTGQAAWGSVNVSVNQWNGNMSS